MTRDKLKAAVLGLKDGGEKLLSIAAESEYFDIVAVAEKEAEVAQNTAKQYGCAAFDDYRQLVIQNELDCVLVAAGMYSCEQYLRAAIKKKFNVFKLPPLARNFEEASEFVRLTEAEGVKLSVPLCWRYSKAFEQLHKSVRGSGIEKILLVTVTCEYRREYRPAWHGDPELAGGGVLLRDSYDIIDTLVQAFGVPEQVYSLVTSTAADRQQRHALTEDTAVVTMKYGSDLCMNLVAMRATGPELTTESINCFGKDKVLMLERESLTIESREGETISKDNFEYDERTAFEKTLEDFALSIIEPEENPLRCGGR